MVRISALPRRTANRPGSQRMARYKITDFLQSASAGRHAADGDRPRSGGSIQMRPTRPTTLWYCDKFLVRVMGRAPSRGGIYGAMYTTSNSVSNKMFSGG